MVDRQRQREARAARRPVLVICVDEASSERLWLHRQLVAAGIESHVIDATSLQVDRRAWRAKTDAIDVDGLLRALIAYAGGERGRCRMVRVPSVAQEDAKRTHRERKRLVNERTGHSNRIKALLALQGITDHEPIKAGRRQRLDVLVTRDGEPLPPRLCRELSRELDRLELVLEQLAEVEAEQNAIVPDQAACGQAMAMIAQPMRLRDIGPETATILAREVFYRDFANRKAAASYAGLTPSLYMSGTLQRDQGISKADNRVVRTAVSLAMSTPTDCAMLPAIFSGSFACHPGRERPGIRSGHQEKRGAVAL